MIASGKTPAEVRQRFNIEDDLTPNDLLKVKMLVLILAELIINLSILVNQEIRI